MIKKILITMLSVGALSTIMAAENDRLTIASPFINSGGGPETPCLGDIPNFQEVNAYTQGNPAISPSVDLVNTTSPSVGELVFTDGTTLGICTGTLLKDNIFLTAGTCLIDGDKARDLSVRFNFENDSNGTLETVQTVQVSSIVEQVRTGDVNYALLKLEGNLTVPPATLSTVVPENGEIMTVIQHPDAEVKQVAFGAFKNVDDNNRFNYEVDTINGSFGAGVLNANGELVAIHTTDGCTNTTGTNNGVSIAEIKKVSQTMTDIIDLAPITLGETVTDTLTRNTVSTHRSVDNRQHFAKFFTFTLEERKNISIALSGSADPYVYLLNGASTVAAVIAQNDDANSESSDAALTVVLEAGTYTIEATTFESTVTGDITLEISEVGPVVVVPNAPSNLAVSEITESSATLTWEDNSDNETGFVITNNGAEIATVDAGVTTLALTDLTPDSTNNITVKAINGNESSAEITATFTTLILNTGNTIGLNDTVTGSYTPDTLAVNRSGTFAQFYTFEVLEDGTVLEINLESATDTFLFLLDGENTEGAVIAANDDLDGSNNRNSRLIETLDAGFYTIEATTFSQAAGGDFSVTTLIK